LVIFHAVKTQIYAFFTLLFTLPVKNDFTLVLGQTNHSLLHTPLESVLAKTEQKPNTTGLEAKVCSKLQ